MIKIIKALWLAVWAVLIFQLSSIPGDAFTVPTTDAKSYAAHLLLYFVLAVLFLPMVLSWRERKNLDRKIIMATLVFCALYGASDEFHQHFVVGRDASVFDWGFDVIGAAMGVWMYNIAPRFIGDVVPFVRLPRGENKPTLLLHICCAGCGVYVSKQMKEKYNVVLFYFNPNIFPQDEYENRLKEVKRIADKFFLPLIIGAYDHKIWLKAIKGREVDSEKGERCRICYRYRLEETARLAKTRKFACFTTTLSVSPHKDAQAINVIGKELAGKYGIEFLEKDFKKQDGYKKSAAMSRDLGLYRQNYCGCEFSR